MANKKDSSLILIKNRDVFWNLIVSINPKDRDEKDYPIIRLSWGFYEDCNVDTKPDMAELLILQLQEAIKKLK